MTAPKRIQMTRNTPWRKDNPNAVIVDRRTKWGNPFRVGDEGVPDAQTAVRLFYEHLLPYRHGMGLEVFMLSEANLRWTQEELRGKDLACWCALDAPCHADVLLKLANEVSL